MYDHSRVSLHGNPSVEGSDFINASYIDSYEHKKAFIATQGPLENTSEQFWDMVWEQEVCAIVMLTAVTGEPWIYYLQTIMAFSIVYSSLICAEDGKVKCAQYWPDPDESPIVVGKRLSLSCMYGYDDDDDMCVYMYVCVCVCVCV